MRIKKGDKVRVISGEYKGVEGNVLKSFPKLGKVIVEKVNFVKKHQRPTQQNPSGGVVEMEAPINVSNVQLICPKCGKPSKPRIKILEDKSRVRYCAKCGDMI
ncbi:MAG TPA: 50S ribosomal protein L24 [Candidatus Cloacimonetes bacterium]|nr:50S ribosomal protein L24 [Candidatus Cloacimonadota bacterium]HEX37886.1 50S ribosomal protein L24 [Candidatus Cloacimonadota bacterium]